MYLERLLQINMATMAALGASLLGMGRDDVWLTLGISMAAGSSVLLTDITGWFRLNKSVGYVAALAASVWCLQELRELPLYLLDMQELDPLTVETLIPTLAKLLIYLQVILLFQEKDDRTYWQLIMLSLLQVVVATLPSQGAWFGLLLIVYMLVGSSALTLLCLHRVWSNYRSTAGREPAPSARGQWPMAEEQSSFASMPGGDDSAGIGWELYGRLSIIAVGSFAVTLILFYTVPRSGQPTWRRASVFTQPKHVVGFDAQVTLGELGEIIESPERVMEITLTEPGTNKPCLVEGEELYLRGAVLTHYQNGRWRNLRLDRDRGQYRALPAVSPPRNLARVNQHLTIEPLDRHQLFCVWPFYQVRQDPRLRFNYKLKQLVRRDDPYDERRKFDTQKFDLSTTGLVRPAETDPTEQHSIRRQVRLIPPDEVLCGRLREIEDNPDWLEPYLQLPQDPRLERLEDLAEKWLSDSGNSDAPRITQANVLNDQFQNDLDRFRYTLKRPAQKAKIDPIEDFVYKNRQGHCEYFATALALMLRSRKIPSRVIVGYRCDEVDSQSRYRVRQLHAHTWVEAYLGPEDIQRYRFPDELFRGEAASQWEHGAWLRLEPTPSTSGIGGAGGGLGLIRRIREGLMWIQSFWSRYVLEMDQQRQDEAIYQPVARAVRRLIGRLGLAIGVVAAAVVLLLVLRICRRRSVRWGFWGRWTKKAASFRRGKTVEVPFYRRMEALLARHGLVRRAGQTQREFATDAGSRLVEVTGDGRLALLPGCVVEAFYRVRFGSLPLDRLQTERVERALDRLAACEVSRAG